jgi:ferredoxin
MASSVALAGGLGHEVDGGRGQCGLSGKAWLKCPDGVPGAPYEKTWKGAGPGAYHMRREATMAVKIDESICTGCGFCTLVCGLEALTVDGGKAVAHAGLCVECGGCLGACPAGAMSLPAASRVMGEAPGFSGTCIR